MPKQIDTKIFCSNGHAEVGALGMLWAIGVMDQLTNGSKVSKQIIIKEKKKKNTMQL